MPRRDDRGFTVVEVLVALAAAAMTLAAIANLAHGAARSGVRPAARLAEVALARTLLSFPVDRAGAGEPLSGEAAGGLRWTLAMSQPTDEAIAGAPAGGWTPAIVRLDVRQAGGADWSVETVRLVKAAAEMTALRRSRRRALGFSLVESLVTLALTGVLLAAIGALTGQWLPAWRARISRACRGSRLWISRSSASPPTSPRPSR